MGRNRTPSSGSGAYVDPATDSEPYLRAASVDANLHQQATYTDALGRQAYAQTLSGASQTPFGSGVTSYGVTRYQYDPTGTLHAGYDPTNAATTFAYNALGWETAMRDANRGLETYTEDFNGNLTETVDARGASGTIYAGYDGLNRQLWRNTTTSPTGASVTYTYDTGANATGRLNGETFSNANVGGSLFGSYAFTYDARGQVTGATETVGGTPYLTSASYNDAGQLTSQTYPNNDILTTSYDAASGWQTGLSVQLGGVGSPLALLSGETYSGAAGAMGLLTSATLGAFSGGSGDYSASYDALGRVTSAGYHYTPSGGTIRTLYHITPTYDALSNVIELVTTLPQGTDTQVFCEDDLSRLTWAGSTGTPACSGAPTPGDTSGLVGTGAQYSASYAYDTMNRLTSAPLGGYTYGDSAHADAATAIAGTAWTAGYDLAGNMTCRAPTSAQTCAGAQTGWTGQLLAYDNEGRLTHWASFQHQVGTPNTDDFLYDGEGQRVQQVATTSSGATTTTTYVGGLEEITAPSGAPTSTTAYYGGLALSVNGALSYTLSDGLGSVSAAVATDGSVTATQLYGPYGAVRYQSGTLPTSYGYTGQRADAATGLDYYTARYYDPIAVQFTSADTVQAGGLNRYAYVGGNPESATDPSGHIRDSLATDYNHVVALQGEAASHDHVWFSDPSTFLSDTAQFFLGTDTLKQSYYTLFLDQHATTGDKWQAVGAAPLTIGTDGLTIATTLMGDPEVGDAARGADAALLATDAAGDLGKVGAVATDALRGGDGALSGGDALSGGANCGLSFAADTAVATPSGERPIASLHVGDPVVAYDPTTGQRTTQTVVKVFLNHDHDRLDVTLALPSSHAAPGTTPTTHATTDAETARERARAVAGHGLRAPPDVAATMASAASATSATASTEVIHTTANHPWLTADHGWLEAGKLHPGEPVRLLHGGTATVVALRTLPGVGPMWDLSLDSVHTFAVGDVQAVAHNCGDTVAQARKTATSALGNSLQEPHTLKSMAKRGWTQQEIVDTINSGTGTITADITGGIDNPQIAVRFTNQAGRAVTVNASTGRIVQLGNADYLYNDVDQIAMDQGWRP